MIRSLRGPQALFVLALSVGTAAQAQAQAVINGRVTTESGQPLQGANVFITELNVSVGTNQTGNYTISIPAARATGQAAVLRVRSVGYAPLTRDIRVTGTQTVNFELRRDVTRLSDVVVTGVSAATEQIKVPFAVARVDSSQMPVTGGNALTQLQGKIPGANIVAASGRPGAAPAVVLRGPTSINASGRSQGPLYIVDGVLLNGATPDLNPNDIESIEVVKGAAAASLYGARAGGGVINITTKSGGGSDGVKFGFRTEIGRNDIPTEFSLAEQTAVAFDPTGMTYCANVSSGSSPCARYIDMETERYRVNNVATPHAAAPQAFMNDGGIALNPGRYRLLNLYQSTPFPVTYSQIDQATKADLWSNANADVTGRVGSTGFYASLGYSKQSGAFEYLDGYQRTTARLNLDQNFGDRLRLQANSFYSIQNEDGGVQDGGTAFFRLSRQPGFINQSTRDSQGRLYVRSNPLNQGSQNDNPLRWLEQYNNSSEGTRFIGSARLNYDVTSWLDLSGDFAYDRGTSTTLFLQDRGWRTTQENPADAVGFIQNNAGDSRSLNTSFGAVATPQLIDNLATTFSVRAQYDQQNSFSQFGYGENIAVPGLLTADAAIANRDIGSGTWEVQGMSYFGSVDLDYLDRYILSASLRREGSSLFGQDQRWATFPRLAGAWIASRESWWPAAEALSLAKFRIAYGKAGVRPSRLAQYETFGVTATGALSPQTLGNRDLRLEILSEVETGVDLELFGKYALSVTYAQSNNDDQLLLVPAPASSGFPNQWQNAGQLQNKTWEASLDVPLVQSTDVNWSTRVIYSRNRAVITRLDVPPYNTTGGLQGTESIYFVREGERLGTMYGRSFITECGQLPGAFAGQCGSGNSQFQRNDDGYIVWTGGMPLNAGITQNAWQAFLPAADAPFNSRASWGLPILLRDSTGTVQQVALGNGQPDFQAGISTNFSWRKFTAFALFDGSFGREVFNEGYHWALGDFMTGTTDQGNDVGSAKPLGYFYRAGPAPAGGSTGVGGLYDVLGASNESVEDASFVKLREVLLSYNVGPVGGRGNWTVGLVGRNLLTFTEYRGYDPEVGSGGSQLNSAALNAIDYFSFPNLRTFTFQLSSSF